MRIKLFVTSLYQQNTFKINVSSFKINQAPFSKRQKTQAIKIKVKLKNVMENVQMGRPMGNRNQDWTRMKPELN